MAQCRVRTSTLLGVEAFPVDAEVDVGAGLPVFAIVGLADMAVQEARERVRSAIRASGFDVPNARVVVNLAPVRCANTEPASISLSHSACLPLPGNFPQSMRTRVWPLANYPSTARYVPCLGCSPTRLPRVTPDFR